MYGYYTAQRQYDAQCPDNEMPEELVCSECNYPEQRKNTYTVDGEIMCDGCFDDYCKEKYDEHGEEFFEDHKEEYTQEWFKQLCNEAQQEIICTAFDGYIKELPNGHERDVEAENIERFCTCHGDWQDYIMRVEGVEHNG